MLTIERQQGTTKLKIEPSANLHCHHIGKLGANLNSLLYQLFFMNELLAEKKQLPLTDEELEEVIREDFADHPSVLSSLRYAQGRNRIGVWRSQYNRGLLKNQQPVRFSFQYDSSGRAVNRNNNPLSEAQKSAKIALHGRRSV